MKMINKKINKKKPPLINIIIKKKLKIIQKYLNNKFK